MKQLIYRSQPFGFDSAMLAGILSGARRNNKRDAITGALICREDLYLQLIEGPAASIDTLYAKIAVDDRHGDVRMLFADEVSERLFPLWEMLDDQSPSLMWSRQEVRDGAIEAAGAGALRATFVRLSESAALAAAGRPIRRAARPAIIDQAEHLRHIGGVNHVRARAAWRRALTIRAGDTG